MADDATDPAADDVVDADEASVATDAEPTGDDGSVEPAADDEPAADAAPADDDDEVEEEAIPESEAKKKADAVIAARRAKDPTLQDRKVERRVVTSRRVTPKAGTKPTAGKDDPPAAESKARDAKKTEQVRARTTAAPIQQAAAMKGPSPWWVPVIMFGLIIVGALAIMLNYMGAFGDPDNVRLVIGLVLILGGIVTATQYR